MNKSNKQKISVKNLTDFNINQIFDCGQIFRYFVDDNHAFVVSKDKFACVKTKDDEVEIFSEDAKYFENFFDLKTDYTKIKNELKKDDFLRPCCEFGAGIRILKQDLFEMIVSFIVSANNNIKRIKNSLNFLAKKFGEKKKINRQFVEEYFDLGTFLDFEKNPLLEIENFEFYYFAFPTLTELKKATIQDFVDAGLGYRASQMFDTIQKLTQQDIDTFYDLTFEEQMKFLLGLKGIGEKVANCVMLFSGASTKMFPVDTWINKVYNDITKTTNKTRKQINTELIEKYQDLAGYAQQYFFYFYRENGLN